MIRIYLVSLAVFLSHLGLGKMVRADDPASIHLLFVGDIMLDNGPGHWITHGRDPFEHCADLLLAADLTIGNLECVVGKGGTQVNKAYVFRAATDSPSYLKKYFDAVSLANNHTWDFGPEGLSESLRILRDSKVAYFGGGDNIDEARRPLVLECKGRKIALLGYNEFRAEQYAAGEKVAGNAPLLIEQAIHDVAKAKEKLNCDLVIPYLHWGEELEPHPRPDQQAMARRMIDAGAAAVIGTHPHVTQTIDIYRGAPIVYSLGNFVFDYYPGDPEEWYGWLLHLNIDSRNRVEFETTVVKLDPVGIPRVGGKE